MTESSSVNIEAACATAYVWDEQLMKQCNKIPVFKGRRASMVHSLIEAYELLNKVKIVSGKPASHKDICKFHDKPYVDFLRFANKEENIRNADSECEDVMDKFGLGYDCPILKRMFNFARVIAGGSLQAAQQLLENSRIKRSINWFGGWHHAQRSEAQGFCYVNDIALAIYKLLEKYSRVLYIDLDVHHGNGVEEAFKNDCRVVTLSFHLYEPGYFPCSGALQDVGGEVAKFFTVNVPLQAGLSDKNMLYIFSRVSENVHSVFAPEAVVVQCGADGLSRDPLGNFSLSLHGIGDCVKRVLAWDLPTLFLGGGGYNLANTARLWTYLTSLIVEKPIENEIPDNEYFLDYGEGYSYELHISPGLREDLNSPSYLDHIGNTISENLLHIKRS